MAELNSEIAELCEKVKAAQQAFQLSSNNHNRMSLATAMSDLELCAQSNEEAIQSDTEMKQQVDECLVHKNLLQVRTSSPESGTSSISTSPSTPSQQPPEQLKTVFRRVDKAYHIFTKTKIMVTAEAFNKQIDRWDTAIDQCEDDLIDLSTYDDLEEKVGEYKNEVFVWLSNHLRSTGAAVDTAGVAAGPAAAPSVQPYAINLSTAPPPPLKKDAKIFPQWLQEFENYCADRRYVDDDAKLRALFQSVKAIPEADVMVRQSTSLQAALAELRKEYFRPYERASEIIIRYCSRTPLMDDEYQRIYDFIKLLEADLACLNEHGCKSLIYSAWFMMILKRKLPPNLRRHCSEELDDIDKGQHIWKPKVEHLLKKLAENKDYLRDKILSESGRAKTSKPAAEPAMHFRSGRLHRQGVSLP